MDKEGKKLNSCIKNNDDNGGYENERFLPVEMLTEILTRLPAKSLGRSQCVCKLWCAVIRDRRFITLFWKRSGPVYEYTEKNPINGDEATFRFLHTVDGMNLERNLLGKYYIRNPTTKYTFALPDPPYQCHIMRMVYLPNTGNYKLVYFHCKEGAKDGGCQVLTLGTDLAWRTLDCASFYNLGDKGKTSYAVTVRDVCFVFRLSNAALCSSEIVCLEMETEHFVYANIPCDLSTNLKDVKICNWEMKFSLANLGEGELQLWVLEDYKSEKWSKRKIVIPSTLFAKNPQARKTPLLCSYSDGWLCFPQDESLVFYHLETKFEFRKTAPPGKRRLYVCLSTPVNLLGNSLKTIIHSPRFETV